MKKIIEFLFLSFCVAFGLAASGSAIGSECKSSPAAYKFKPTIIDGASESGAVIGVEYDVSGEIAKCLDSGEDIFESDSEVTVYQVSGGYRARGILAADARRNPSDFLDVSTIAGAVASGGFGTLLAGMDVAYEASQDFDNKQLAFSLSVSYSKLFDKVSFAPDGAFFSVDTGWGRIEPIDDELRSAAIGEENLAGFYRWSVEGLLNIPIRTGVIKAVEFNVRYFQEVNASADWAAAGFTDTEFGCDDETGGEPWEREGYSAASTSLRL